MRIVSILLLLYYQISSTIALDNGLARTPPMGWMSWAAFYCETNCTAHPNACISEQLYMDMADRLVEDGYKDVGYTNIHIDDCWMSGERDANGRLVADKQRFPSGIKKLAQYMHSKDLSLGIYADIGLFTCAGYPGSYKYEKKDAETFAEWECDYLKYDGCNIDLGYFPIGYPKMSRALNATGKPIVYSCEWPFYMMDFPELIDYSEIGRHCNLFRNYEDVRNNWKSIMSIVRFYDKWQDKNIPAHGPGHWLDPDMLVGGNAGITVNMARSQMTIWAIWSAPLILSNDLRTLGNEFKAIFQNKDVIAVDQDPMGKMGRLMLSGTFMGVYSKPIHPLLGKRTSFAIAVLNRNENAPNQIKLTFSEVGLKRNVRYNVTNLWSGESLGVITGSSQFQAVIRSADSVLLRAEIIGTSFHDEAVKRKIRIR